MRVLGLAGYSGSGKTTMLNRIVPLMRARGLTVATAKHAHHGFDPLPHDHPAAAWREAGAREVLWSDRRSRLHLHELRGAPEPGLHELLPLMPDADLLLVEGYKFGDHEKIEVHRAEGGTAPLAARDSRVIALVTDDGQPTTPPLERNLPIFRAGDAEALVDFILAWMRRAEPRRHDAALRAQISAGAEAGATQ